VRQRILWPASSTADGVFSLRLAFTVTFPDAPNASSLLDEKEDPIYSGPFLREHEFNMGFAEMIYMRVLINGR
jgi:hypothetical protein